MLQLTKQSAITEITYSKDEDVKVTIRPLSIAERAEVRDMVSYNDDSTLNINAHKQYIYIFRKCVKDIQGIVGMEFEVGPLGVATSFMDALPLAFVTDIAGQIFSLSEVSSAVKKP